MVQEIAAMEPSTAMSMMFLLVEMAATMTTIKSVRRELVGHLSRRQYFIVFVQTTTNVMFGSFTKAEAPCVWVNRKGDNFFLNSMILTAAVL